MSTFLSFKRAFVLSSKSSCSRPFCSVRQPWIMPTTLPLKPLQVEKMLTRLSLQIKTIVYTVSDKIQHLPLTRKKQIWNVSFVAGIICPVSWQHFKQTTPGTELHYVECVTVSECSFRTKGNRTLSRVQKLHSMHPRSVGFNLVKNKKRTVNDQNVFKARRWWAASDLPWALKFKVQHWERMPTFALTTAKNSGGWKQPFGTAPEVCKSNYGWGGNKQHTLDHKVRLEARWRNSGLPLQQPEKRTLPTEATLSSTTQNTHTSMPSRQRPDTKLPKVLSNKLKN